MSAAKLRQDQRPFYLRSRNTAQPRRLIALLLIGALHVALLAALLAVRDAPLPMPLPTMMVSMITTAPPPQTPPPPPKPQPKMIATPQPTPSAIEAPPIEEEPVAPPVVEAPPAPPQEPAVIPPNFVAAYLNNPAPSYPPMSVRLREEGQVMLLVLVSAAGRAEQVTIEKSSGYARLDDAAVDVVRQRWRFVPARQGELSVAAWVRIPLSFELKKH